MTWAPRLGFSGVMEDVVVPNVLALIERDFADALSYYDFDLPDFAERSMGQVKRKEFPLVAVGPIGNAVFESEDSARHTQPLRIALYLGVVADNDVTVTELIMKYVKVMHAVLHRATGADYFGSLLFPGVVFGVHQSVEHFYGALLSKETLLFRSATMILTLNFDSR